MGEGMAYGGLPFPDNVCPVPVFGRKYSVWNYLYTQQIYYTNVIAITQLPKMFLLSDIVWECRIYLIALEFPCIMFTYSARIFLEKL